MTNEIKKATVEQKKKNRILLRGLIAFVSIALFLFAAMLIGTAGGVYWLNATADGQRFTAARLSELSSATGYQITYDNPQLDGAGRIRIANLTIADDTGIFLTAANLRLSVSIPALLEKTLSFSGHADSLSLERLPLSETTSPEKQGGYIAAFTVPDIYFKKITVKGLSVDTFRLGAAVAGQELTLNPTLDIQGGLETDSISLAAKLTDASGLEYLPKTISLAAKLNTRSTELDISALKISGPGYDLFAEGNSFLDEKGTIDLHAAINTDKDFLKQVSSGKAQGSIEGEAHITGLLAQPAADLNAKVSNPVINGLTLDDIKVMATLPNPREVKGHIDIATGWNGLHAQLQADTAWQGSDVALTNIAFAGDQMKGAGDVSVNTETLLAAGKITLAGAIEPYAALAGLAMKGDVTASADLRGQEGKQALDATLSATDLRYDDISAKKANMHVRFADIMSGMPSSGEITAQRIVQQKNSINNVHITLTPQKGTDKIAAKIQADGKATIPFSLKGGALINPAPQPAAQNINATVTVEKGGALNITGDYAPDALDLKLIAKDFSLRAIPTLPRLAARNSLSGTVSMTGTAAAPVTKADLTLAPAARSRKMPLASLQVKAEHNNNILRATFDAHGKGIKTLSADAEYPLAFALAPFIFDASTSAPLKGSFHAQADMSALSALFLDGDIALSGDVSASGTLSGTADAPAINGKAAWTKGTLDTISSGIHFESVNVSALFQNDKVVLERMTATDGKKGRLQGKGAVGIAGNTTPLRLTLNMKDMDFLENNRDIDGLFSSNIDVTGDGKNYLIAGDISTETLSINIPERMNDDIPELNVVQKKDDVKQDTPATTVKLDVDFNAPQKVFVRGWGLDAEFGGKLNIGGTLDAPLVAGDMSSIRGRYQDFGRRFDLDHATLHFRGAMPPSPYLDVTAKANVEDITAQVDLGGTISAPKISFSSQPALPENEVLSRILFGKDMSHISAFQALELARTLRRLSGKGGGPDPLGALRGTFGLDDLQVDSSSEGGTTVGAGKYISDKVYLEVESGSGDKGGGANLRVDVTPSIKLESKVGQDAAGGGGIFWEKDY